jgi:dTDP-4-amino-4,6-dideoxygalactose transaminase
LHYVPIPAHALYRRLGYDMQGLPQGQAYWEQALSLPIFPRMEGADVERVADALRGALERPID